jgi:hypothetical protein
MATHRKFLLGIGMVLLALLAFAGVRVVQRWTAKPNIAIDYSAKVREHIEASARARGLTPDKAVDASFERLILDHAAHVAGFVKDLAARDARFIELLNDFAPVDYSLVRATQAEREKLPAVKVELAQLAYADALQSGQLEKLLALRTMGAALRERTAGEPLALQPIPLAAPTRLVARLFATRLREQLAAGDAAGATQSAEVLFAIGGAMSGHGSMMENLVGMACQATAVEAIREAASKPGMDAGLARAMAGVLATRAKLADMSVSLESERLLVLDTVQRTYTDDGSGDGWFVPAAATGIIGNPTGLARVQDTLLQRYASRKETVALADRYFAAASQASKLPRQARDAGVLRSVVSELGPAHPVLEAVLPSVARQQQTFDRFATTIAAVQTLLALELHRSQHGSPPASLDALVPSILPALPIDVFASDGRFRYRLRTPTPDDPRDFMLYSVGGDGVDDGGKFMPSEKRELPLSDNEEGNGYDWPAQLP